MNTPTTRTFLTLGPGGLRVEVEDGRRARAWVLASSPYRTDAEEAEVHRLCAELREAGEPLPLPFEPCERAGT